MISKNPNILWYKSSNKNIKRRDIGKLGGSKSPAVSRVIVSIGFSAENYIYLNSTRRSQTFFQIRPLMYFFYGQCWYVFILTHTN